MASWQSGKLTKWQVDKVASWQSGKLTKWQVDKVVSWQSGKLTKRQVDKLSSWRTVIAPWNFDGKQMTLGHFKWLDKELFRRRRGDCVIGPIWNRLRLVRANISYCIHNDSACLPIQYRPSDEMRGGVGKRPIGKNALHHEQQRRDTLHNDKNVTLGITLLNAGLWVAFS